jgi:putative drug exporter of the RND superfamily
VREEYLGHGDTSRAVADGVAKTACVITAAAAIMVVVVRMVLVAALMQLLARANWWMPRCLDRAVPRRAPEAH